MKNYREKLDGLVSLMKPASGGLYAANGYGTASSFAVFFALVMLAFLVLPGGAYAGGIAEFANPLEQVVNTLQGPVGRSICVIMIVVCAMGYWLQRGEELSGIWKAVTGLVVIMTMVSFGESIVGKLFTFKGAVI